MYHTCTGLAWQFDVGELLEDIKQVTKWFELGLRLGVDHAELTKIEINRKLVELCKADMINLWQQNSGNVTQRNFLSALEEIGHRNLAKQLRAKYNARQTGMHIISTYCT